MLIVDLRDSRAQRTETVGGKNASLARMKQALEPRGIRIPDGFATTVGAYQAFIDQNQLQQEIDDALFRYRRDAESLQSVGRRIRRRMRAAAFPQSLEDGLLEAFEKLKAQSARSSFSVAVRSSATAEDLAEASFAGQLESFLNVSTPARLLECCQRCFASLFTDRAIAYRREQGLLDHPISVSVGVQEMVRSDQGSAGVMFTLDTETGFPGVVLINSAWGLGESVVQGSVGPDEFLVFKPHIGNPRLDPILRRTLGGKESRVVYRGIDRTVTLATSQDERSAWSLSDEDARTLAAWAVEVEKFYGRPMDLEWARDGEQNSLYLVQARPETVHAGRESLPFRRYRLEERSTVLVQGTAVGDGIASGTVRLLRGPEELDRVEPGDVLVAPRTDPDWVPAMKRASAVVTELGGRTSHAAIVSRELGVPAVVGATGALSRLREGSAVTVCCAGEESGSIFEGRLRFSEQVLSLEGLPEAPVPILINAASPEGALRWWRLPSDGIGLARLEFLITTAVRAHPMALLYPERVQDEQERLALQELTVGFPSMTSYFVDRLGRGMALLAASQFPKPVVIRFSDFKTHEYAGLLGGRGFEPHEENPMIGFRGAARYVDGRYREGFALECRALARARSLHGMQNIIPMVPFCRTIEEVDAVLELLKENGLERGREGLKVYAMAEVPSNALLASEFASRFDGLSIGSNDLTQLILGVDRDSEILAPVFDERDPAVKRAISMILSGAHEVGVPVGICGQAPSDHPEFCRFLVDEGIDSISVNPDRYLDVRNGFADQRVKKSA